MREIFFDWLREHRPDLLPRYERLYRNALAGLGRRPARDRAGGRRAVGRAARVDRFRHRAGQRLRERAEAERQRAIEAALRRREEGVQQALF